MKESIERDAYRFMEAKLDYGKGSGTKRKLMKAELERKFQDDSYKEAFNDALMNVDTDAILKKIERKKSMQKAYEGTKTAFRTANHVSNVYSRNKKVVDLIVDIFRDIFFGGKHR